MIAIHSIPAARSIGLGDWSIRQNSSCGGDFAGVVDVPCGGTAFFVGDVTGHGLSACEKARTIEAHVTRLLRRGLMPSAVLQRVDTELQFGDGFGPFATLFLALLNPVKRVLWYSSAGHPTALVFTGRHHKHLDPTGPLLGLRMRETSAFAQRIVSLSQARSSSR